MKKITFAHCGIIVLILIGTGCMNRVDPVIPDSRNDLSLQSVPRNSSNIHLWGLYEITIEPTTGKIHAVPNRQAAFTANVVNFINSKPAGLGFHINKTEVSPAWLDVDIDVTITHPFPGLPQYNGYDVRGVFMGDGSKSLEYNPDLVCAVPGVDQLMLPDPTDGLGGPDGYTRWFNAAEFSLGGMPLFQYTQGKLAAPGYSPSATLNPYKYFADGLGKDENLCTWLWANFQQHGIFSSGKSNTRNYYLRFPNGKGVKYGYAIIANWGGVEPQYHPSNAPEAVAVKVVDNSTVYYAGPSDKGGNIKLDISVWDWDSSISAGVMEDYRIFIESTVLSAPYELSALEMTPIAGTDYYSTYQVEIFADNVTSAENNEYWVIVESQKEDYTNDFSVNNLADKDKLAACFRYDLKVSTSSSVPVCSVVVDPSSPAMPYTGWETQFTFDASGSYDPGGGTLSYEWDFNNDGAFGDSFEGGTDSKPVKTFNFNNQTQVCVRVTNSSGKHAECCVPVNITVMKSKNIPLRAGVNAYDLAVDHGDGDLLIVYSDGQVWRYLESAYYQTGSLFYNTNRPGVNHIDISPNGRSKTGGNNDKTVCWHASYDADGNLLSGSMWNNPGYGVYEIAAVTFDTSNDQIALEDWPNIAPYADYHYNRYLNYYNFNIGSGWYAWDGSGVGAVNHKWLKGMESSKTGGHMFVLEGAPEFRVERWNGGTWVYAGLSWGGIQTDGMTGFNDPRDLTRDSNENYYVLDKLTTAPAIKKYTSSGSPVGSPFGSSGIAGDPLKIEGSDRISPWDNLLFVLHDGGGSNPDLLSIFFKWEIP